MVGVGAPLVLVRAPQRSVREPPTSRGAPLASIGDALERSRRPFVLVREPPTEPRRPQTSMGGCAPRRESRKVLWKALLEKRDHLEVPSQVRKPEPSGLPDELAVLQ